MRLYMLYSDFQDGQWILHGIYSTHERACAAKVALLSTTNVNPDYMAIDPIPVDAPYDPVHIITD